MANGLLSKATLRGHSYTLATVLTLQQLLDGDMFNSTSTEVEGLLLTWIDFSMTAGKQDLNL
jgi:hypothetical protein